MYLLIIKNIEVRCPGKVIRNPEEKD